MSFVNQPRVTAQVDPVASDAPDCPDCPCSPGWDGLRTLLAVGRHGTVSGAAAEQGIHHATVIRQVRALEAQVGIALFHRGKRGYVPTEAGRDVIELVRGMEGFARRIDERIAIGVPAANRAARPVVVASSPLVGMLVSEASAQLVQANPACSVAHQTLGAGPLPVEADVIVGAGARPEDSARRIRDLAPLRPALYAAPAYVALHGLPGESLEGHRVLALDGPDGPLPATRWIERSLPREAVALRASDPAMLAGAFQRGLGLAFLDEASAARVPGAVRVLPPRREWEVPVWIATAPGPGLGEAARAMVDALLAASEAVFPGPANSPAQAPRS